MEVAAAKMLMRLMLSIEAAQAMVVVEVEVKNLGASFNSP